MFSLVFYLFSIVFQGFQFAIQSVADSAVSMGSIMGMHPLMPSTK